MVNFTVCRDKNRRPLTRTRSSTIVREYVIKAESTRLSQATAYHWCKYTAGRTPSSAKCWRSSGSWAAATVSKAAAQHAPPRLMPFHYEGESVPRTMHALTYVRPTPLITRALHLNYQRACGVEEREYRSPESCSFSQAYLERRLSPSGYSVPHTSFAVRLPSPHHTRVEPEGTCTPARIPPMHLSMPPKRTDDMPTLPCFTSLSSTLFPAPPRE